MSLKLTKFNMRTLGLVALMIFLISPVSSYVMLLVMILGLYILNSTVSNNYQYQKTIMSKKVIYFFTFVIMIFWGIQMLIINNRSFVEMTKTLQILSMLFLGVILLLVSNRLFSFDLVTSACCYFNIIFSIYYLLQVAIKGLPEDRDSILGYVSANYCAAVLYLSFPLLLYYLFSGKEQGRCPRKSTCVISISMGLIVILLSGSKTALGVIAAIAVTMLVFKQTNKKDKLRIVVALGIVLAVVAVLYNQNQAVNQLLGRAMDAFSGVHAVNEDVRNLVWRWAIGVISSSNHLWGTGSNTVDFRTTYRSTFMPAHNIVLEILLTGGIVLFVIFIFYIIYVFFHVIRKTDYFQKAYIFQMICITLLTVMIQPFYTTSYLCPLLTFCSFVCISRGKDSE